MSAAKEGEVSGRVLPAKDRADLAHIADIVRFDEGTHAATKRRLIALLDRLATTAPARVQAP